MHEWVCLLRAVNLGARNKVAMPRLREALTAAGFTDVRTYVQSGNVVLGADTADAAEVAATVCRVVHREFHLVTPVVMRSPGQIRDVLAWCPFPREAAAEPTLVHVVFLDTAPDPARAAATAAEDWSPDRLAIRGSEACVRYADTMHTSRLQHATLLRRLGVTGTARNWRTLTAVERLLS